MTKILYVDDLEELVQLMIEKELYGKHSNVLIRFDNRTKAKKIFDNLNKRYVKVK